MSITKYYKFITPQSANADIVDNHPTVGNGLYGNYTWYHRLVQGSPTRLSRYREYDAMDADNDVAIALDMIAEEMTGNASKVVNPLNAVFDDALQKNIRPSVVSTVNAALKTWCNINEWEERMFPLSRACIKYGDVFFRRNPQKNKKLEFLHCKNVVGAVVKEIDVTDITAWHVKVDSKYLNSHYSTSSNFSGTTGDVGQEVVLADDIVRFSLYDEMSEDAPFGKSVLACVYRAFKHKELLEDALIIYRIQRAPEKRVFYINTGRMHPQKVAQHLEQIKNEIKQKKIPTAYGGKQTVESVYNPQSMCLSLDTKIPLLDGREVMLNELITEHDNGKQNWVYSIDVESGEVVPGIISWAGVTQKNVETIKITLNNNEEIIVTPEHKIPVKGKGYVEAQYLTPDDLLYRFDEHQLYGSDEQPYFDVYINNIEKFDKMDVGTLTIDKDHKYHSHHNFAISSGIYVKNSEDFFFSIGPNGEGSRVETLPGGQSLGELADLDYFYAKLWRGLRIPQSYIASNSEGAPSTDGKVGIAYLQEIKFTLYIERLQKFLEKIFDTEFKRFLEENNIKVDHSLFKIRLPEPSNFAKSRQQQMDTDLLQTYSTTTGMTELSRRFALRTYLQLTEAQIIENERMKREELGLPIDGDNRDLPKIYNPDAAEAGGFEGGLGGMSSGGSSGGGLAKGLDTPDVETDEDGLDSGDETADVDLSTDDGAPPTEKPNSKPDLNK